MGVVTQGLQVSGGPGSRRPRSSSALCLVPEVARMEERAGHGGGPVSGLRGTEGRGGGRRGARERRAGLQTQGSGARA